MSRERPGALGGSESGRRGQAATTITPLSVATPTTRKLLPASHSSTPLCEEETNS